MWLCCLPLLFSKIARKLKSLVFWFLFKSSLPKRNFYSGLVGCGHVVRYAYVPAFNQPNNPIVCLGLYSRSVQSSEDIRKRLRYKTKVFTSYEDLVNSGINSVIITVPNHQHYYYVAESLKRNLDVFCEKPLVNSLEDVYRLKFAVENSRRILMVGFNQRYLDRIKKLKLLLESGDIGRLREVYVFHNQNIEKHLRKSDWLNDTKKSGGGILHNAAVHLINAMLYLFGKIDKVSCEFKNIKMPISYGEDTASCKFIFTSGLCGFLKASFIGGVDSTYEHMIIKGDTGVVTSDMKKNNIIIRYGSKHIKNVPCRMEFIQDSFYNELVHFYNCIKHRRMPDTDIDDSIETLKVTEAARISAIEKRPVGINEVDRGYAKKDQ